MTENAIRWYSPPISDLAEGFDDGVESFKVEQRKDGIYVGLESQSERINTVGDLMMQTLSNWGIKQFFGMVGRSNLGVADALRIQEEKGNINYYGIRYEGVAAFAGYAYGKHTGRPAACLSIALPPVPSRKSNALTIIA